MTSALEYTGNLKWLMDNVIYLTVHGSNAYGTNTPTSDLDIKGVCVPPNNYLMGFNHKFEQADKSFNYDTTIYGVQKFFELAANCNPNIIEVLWVEDSDIITATNSGGKVLRKNKERFLSKKARHTFSGYATAQLKRIKGHRSWLLNPPSQPPSRAEYGLPPLRKADKDQVKAAEFLLDQGYGYGSNFQEMIEKEKAFGILETQWEQYQNWKANRNPDRAALEAKFGFDLKHAGHLYRLMVMCGEIATEGKVIVKRPDRDIIMAIKNGEWSYEKLVGWAEDMDNKMDELYENSSLPNSPDREYLDELCCQIVSDSYEYDFM